MDRIRLRCAFIVFGMVLGLVVSACGTSPHHASQPANAPTAPTATADGGADETEDDSEDDDAAGSDADGDVEASSGLAAQPNAPCPRNMVLVESADARFCIDKYEASLVEVDADGNEKPFPHWLTVDGHVVRAVSEPDVFPQGFISEVQAEDACAASGKRLCAFSEWKTACMGPEKTTFPYGAARRPGTCHDTGRSAVAAVFGLKALADPVASAPPNKTARVASAKAAAPSRAAAASSRAAAASSRAAASKATAGAKPKTGTSAASKTAATASRTAKPGRQAHVTTKGRAAETTKQRAARPGAVAAKPSKRRGDKNERTAARGTKRVPAAAKASARPVSVAPSVWTQLNDPRLGQVDGALAKTGSHEECVNGYGVLDMVGNLHEWVKTDPSAPHGTFAGGYFLDTTLNGDGCQYRTTAHAHDYHDYSTGFRCCADASAAEAANAAPVASD